MPIDHPDFRRAMMEAGLVPPTELVDDGRIHRCGIDGKKRSNRSGAYSITPDGMFGGMQNWSSGSGWESWRAVMPSQLTPAQREAILEVGRQATTKRIAEEKLGHERARLKAIDMWGKAVEGAHPYLDRKGICSNGSRGGRVMPNGMLLMSPDVPLDIMATKLVSPWTRDGISRANSP